MKRTRSGFRLAISMLATIGVVAGCSTAGGSAASSPSLGGPQPNAVDSTQTTSPAAVTPSATTAAAGPAALAWLEPATGSGKLDSRIVLGDTLGNEERQIPLPRDPWLLYATSVSQTMLVQGTDSWMLVKAAGGMVETLDFGATSPEDVQALAHSGRWWVLGTASGTDFLVDVQTGKLTSFESLGLGQVLGTPVFSPDGNALLTQGLQAEVTTLGAAPATRPIAAGLASFVSFSPDGARLIYSVKSGARIELMSEEVDGSDSQVLLDSSVAIHGAFMQDTRHLLIVDAKGVAILDVTSGQATLLTTGATIDDVTGIEWSSDRTKALLTYTDSTDRPQWLYVDGSAPAATVVPDLANHRLTASGNDQATGAGDDRLFGVADASLPADFKLVDLSTGSVRSLTGMDSRATFQFGSARMSGKWILAGTGITANGDSLNQVWLIDGSSGQAVYIEEAVAVRAMISPDATRIVGCHWDGKSSAGIDIFDLASGARTPIATGYDAVWLAP